MTMLVLKKTGFLFLVSLLLCLVLFASCGDETASTTATETLSTTVGTSADTTAVLNTEGVDTDLTTAPVTTAVVVESTTLPLVTEAPKPAVGNPTIIGYPSTESDVLPTLSINTENGTAITSRDEYINASISVSGTTDDEVYGFTDRTSEVRCRGNYTYTETAKKSYRLKFTEKINLFGQGNGPAKSWVLLANHCDQTFLRNHVAFTMGRELSCIEYCSSSSLVKLYVNGEYLGIYQVAEQHQINKYRVNINEDPEALDTDYLIERDSYASDSGEEGVAYFRINRTKYRIHNEYLSEEKCAYVKEYMQKAHDAVLDGNRVNVQRYIDIDSMVDTMILQALMKNTDVGYSSFFMVKKAGGKLYFTCPWDFDLALGNDERLDEGEWEGLYVGAKSGMSQEHEWFYLLMNHEWFCNRVRDRWNEVKDNLYRKTLNEIDRIYACFGDEIATNFTVWKIFGRQINKEPRAIRALKSYEAHVQYLRNWYMNRYQYLDDLFNSQELYNQGGTYNGGWGDGWWGGW